MSNKPKVRIWLRTSVFGALFLCAASSLAQVPLTPLDAGQLSSIDDFIHQEMARERIPGLELGIYSRGRILLTKGYGLANVELNAPVTPETLMEAASVSKQFVAAAIMMLVEDGKLSLDDSITKYFPDAPATWKPILIKNLLSHTSGLPEYSTANLTGPDGPFYLRLDFTEDELTTKIETLPVESAPGAEWNYRNTNYELLGFIIHKITGMPYAEFLGERIFKPLGMSTARIISDRDIVPNRAAGYEIVSNGKLINQEWASSTFNSLASGSLCFTVLDMARWDEALYGTKLLKQSSLDRMWSVYPLNDGQPNSGDYGFGWYINTQNGRKRIEHSGALMGFSCDISRYPDDSLTVVVFSNLDAYHSYPTVVAHVVAGMVDPALTEHKLETIADDQPALATRLKKLLDEIATGIDIRPELSPKAAALITPDKAKQAQQGLANFLPGGTLTLVMRVKGSDGGPQWVSTYRLIKGADAVLVAFGLGDDGKISDFNVFPNREYE